MADADIYDDTDADPAVMATARHIAIATDDLTSFLALGGTINEWQELKHD